MTDQIMAKNISDHMFREEAISAEARQTSFNKMMEIALGI